MRRMRTLTAGAAVILSTVAGAAALGDTVRLGSGDVIEGKVADEGDRLRVTTATGELTLRWKDVDAVLRDRTAKDVYLERRRAVKDTDAAGLYALGLWAGRAGLAEEARKCFDTALVADPEHAGARDALSQQKKDGAWLGGSKLLEAKGFVARDGAWLLREEAALLDRRAAEKDLAPDEKKVEAILAQAARSPASTWKFALDALDGTPKHMLVRPGLRALRRGQTAESRELGARVLGKVTDDRDVVRPLILAAVLDREATVRSAAVESLAALDVKDLARPIARAMWSDDARIRMNAEEALGGLAGASRAQAGGSVEWLITRWSTSGGPGGRNSIFIGSEITYISDFDVEIAQAAQIGDPIVGKIREGVMLDTRVLSVREEFTTAERRVIWHALTRATGKDFGEDVAAWKTWWDETGKASMTAQLDVSTSSVR